jgi:Leucine-rich repeat (LRR) protein
LVQAQPILMPIRNNDGEIQVSEAAAVTIMYVQSLEIASLIGIQSFTNLQTLNCSYNQLTSLNVQGLTNLQNLYCNNNQLVRKNK